MGMLFVVLVVNVFMKIGGRSEMGCEYAFDHEPGEACEHCGLMVDSHGNTEEDFLNCSFPDCGCDGERLCMAPSGANSDSRKFNVEGMYRRTDKKAVKAKVGLVGLIMDYDQVKK